MYFILFDYIHTYNNDYLYTTICKLDSFLFGCVILDMLYVLCLYCIVQLMHMYRDILLSSSECPETVI